MRIAIVTGIYPPDIGGPATYVPRIAEAFVERRQSVLVAAASDAGSGNDGPAEAYRLVRVCRRPLVSRIFGVVAGVVWNSFITDVVYGVGMHFESALAARIGRRPLVLKVVGDFAWERATGRGWTESGFDEFQTTKQAWRVEALKRFRSWCLRQADAVIVPSEYLARAVASWGVPAERCRVIYNAVQRGSGDAWRARHAAEPLRILTVCRLVPWKGVDTLIRALVALPTARLAVIGEGPCRSELEETARVEGVADRVHFHGAISPQELRGHMRRHHVFALASIYEGLPHVVLEAMEEGLAIVATRAGGTPEVVFDEETGLLVEHGVQPMAEAISRLLTDASLGGRLVEGARAMLRRRFDESVMVEQTEAVLRSTIATRRPEGILLPHTGNAG